MNKFAKLILAAAAALFTFASCASKETGSVPHNTAPVNDGSVYNQK